MKKKFTKFLAGTLAVASLITPFATTANACEAQATNNIGVGIASLSLARALPSWYGSCTQKGHNIDQREFDGTKAGYYSIEYYCNQCRKSHVWQNAGKW